MDVATALGTYLEIVDSCAPGLVEGLYVVGSFALDDWHEGRSDIDIVAVTAEPATDADAGSLRTAHALLSEHVPQPFVDGPYVAWGDLITPPTALHRPWSLEHRFRHDAECFEINPVTWYVLATYGVTVRGPTVDRLGVYLDVEARTQFVVENLRSYWLPLAQRLRDLCNSQPGSDFPASMLEWCALGALRLHVTAFTGDVVSRRVAGEHGLRVAPESTHATLDTALAVRAGSEGAPDSVPAGDLLLAADVIEWCANEVAEAARPQP
ncbi:MAG: nucleotidyltransferase domain-containing protein [Ilumatobacteraceae bacterium]